LTRHDGSFLRDNDRKRKREFGAPKECKNQSRGKRYTYASLAPNATLQGQGTNKGSLTIPKRHEGLDEAEFANRIPVSRSYQRLSEAKDEHPTNWIAAFSSDGDDGLRILLEIDPMSWSRLYL
jgi:hypothetical protein